jgi:anhydro-N-acetylmuramic acid kinase
MPRDVMHVIGLMSGTSLDGIDGVIANCSTDGSGVTCISHQHLALDPDLRDQLLALQTSGPDELHRAAIAANLLVHQYARLVAGLCHTSGLIPTQVQAIGAHGQTVRHRPELGYSWQLNNAALLAELTGIAVVSDFRARDIAAGGQGAPLVPAFHQAAFGRDGRAKVVVNLGGICNISALNVQDSPLGFDIGPSNILMDAWVMTHLGEPFDRNGAWAEMGELDPDLLQALLDEPYFDLPAPKSTGRDLFNLEWLEQRLAAFPCGAPEDVQRTLVELVAVLLANELDRLPANIEEVVLCGGGAHNLTLRECITRHVAASNCPAPVVLSEQYGIAVDQVEALAFAWLAARHLGGLDGNLPAVTGARGARVLGHLTPR